MRYRGHTLTQCVAQCWHTVIAIFRFLALYVYLGTPTSRRINSCLTWRSIDGVACSYGDEQDNDLSLCFSNVIRRHLVLAGHVTASSYLYELLLWNNFTSSFLRNSPGHQHHVILVLANKNVQYSLYVEGSVATIFNLSCYSKYMSLLWLLMYTNISIRYK
jgi:hypothetical protein